MIKKSIAIFGSTGSIGVNAVKLIGANRELFEVKILTANSNAKLLSEQAIELNAKYVHIADESKISDLEEMLFGTRIEVLKCSIQEVALIKTDIVLMAIVGAAAILPTVNAIKAGNNIALANKECLVCAGNLITQLAKKNKVQIIPVDSEHSGLFQVFNHEKSHLIKDVTLTASGGPFREYSLENMKNITKSQALKHPNWAMGEKITIDCATLVNKALEVIEAYHLFPIKADQIKIIIHPESIIHAIANYIDGSMLAQISAHNMQIAISYAFFYPQRARLNDFNQLDLTQIKSLNFHQPEPTKFKSLRILDSILKTIDTNSSLVFNIANEVAVEAFLNNQISFLQITDVIEETLSKVENKSLNSLDDAFYFIKKSKAKANEIITTL